MVLFFLAGLAVTALKITRTAIIDPAYGILQGYGQIGSRANLHDFSTQQHTLTSMISDTLKSS